MVVLPVPTSPVSWTKPPAAGDPVEQVGQRLPVAGAHVEKARIGSDGEGGFAEAEV